MSKEYYKAYDERYKIVHAKGELWFGYEPSPIVKEIIEKYSVQKSSPILEIGAGEGRDAISLINGGFNILATDVSPVAIEKCKSLCKEKADCFAVLDFVLSSLPTKFDFIYSIAVLHMLVEKIHRTAFYNFIKDHLTEGGIALITTMSDGQTEFETDVNKAFDLVERDFNGAKITVANTSCKMVSDQTFIEEIKSSGLEIVEIGHTSVKDHFSDMAYAVVKTKVG